MKQRGVGVKEGGGGTEKLAFVELGTRYTTSVRVKRQTGEKKNLREMVS